MKGLYGASPDVAGLVLIHIAGLATGVAAMLMLPTDEELGFASRVIVFALAVDVGGGVVANGTRSTNDWYATQPLKLSYLFLVVHIIQPVLLSLVVGVSWSTSAFLYLYQLVAGGLVLGIRRPDLQKPMAAVLLTLGVLLYFVFFLPSPALSWFGVLYLIKLVMMFPVDHYAGLKSR
ncbi:MAG: hypothetical protein ACK5N9_19930 [Pirellula sp.]|jgi:hypothetical protein